MLKVKYSDEKYLCKYDLDMDLFKNLNIDIIDLWPTRNIFVLDTKQGKKILKIIDYSEERLNFICKALEYIKNSYNNILEINKLPNKKRFIDWKGNKYILLDLIEGIECNVANPIELELATKGIALMHNASKGLLNYLDEGNKEENINLFNLNKYFDNSKKELKLFKKQVERYVYRNTFDDIYIKEVDYHINEIEECERLLKESNYQNLCKDNKYISLCHNDLAYHNILIKDNEANFIDFDYCNIDLRVRDLWSFIIKGIKKFGFSIEMCKNIISEYNRINTLSKEEYKILYIYIKFPNDFYSISKEYYLKLKDWPYDSYLNKLQSKLEYTKEKKLLLDYFYKEYIK